MNDWRRVFTRRAFAGLAAISIIAPLAYALIQGGLAQLLAPTLRALGIHSAVGTELVVLAFSSAGALIAAAFLAFSHTFLVRQGSLLLGLLLGAITVVTLVVLRSWPEETSASARIAIVEYATFVIACAAASHFAGRNHATAGT